VTSDGDDGGGNIQTANNIHHPVLLAYEGTTSGGRASVEIQFAKPVWKISVGS